MTQHCSLIYRDYSELFTESGPFFSLAQVSSVYLESILSTAVLSMSSVSPLLHSRFHCSDAKSKL